VTGFTTDKVHLHGYLPDYLKLAADIGVMCPSGAVVCEVGVEHGASLKMWQHLFPGSTVIGIDRSPEAPHVEGTIKVTAQQDDPGLTAMIAEHAPDGCHLIVDDASHIGHLSAATFDLLWPLVKPGCWYVLEDWADPWVFPGWARWPDIDPSLAGDELVDYVPQMITALKQGAATVTYTRLGLVIIQKLPA
jgi:hypothetical protein